MIKRKLTVIYLSFFGSGFAPKAPGTFGSIASIPLLWVMCEFPNKIVWALSIGLITFLTCLLTESYQKQHHLHDPQWIVIDEVLGMMTAWLFISWDLNWYSYALSFLLFRFFDIVKIWPASYFDRLEHGAGTILDDIVSGVFAGIISLSITKFFPSYFF